MAQFGLAKTGPFLIGEAEVMVGAQADLKNLNPIQHAIGLVKNFQGQVNFTFTDLTQGLTNQIIDSTRTGTDLTASFEVYEYTAKNIAYASGLDGSNITTNSVATTASAAVTGDGAVVILPVTSETGFLVGDYIALDAGDQTLIRKVSAIDTTLHTVTVTEALATGQNLASGAAVKVFNNLFAGGGSTTPFLSMKVLVKTSDSETQVVYIPKFRFSKGLNLAASSSDYGNLPFEIQAVAQLSSDPFFAEFGDNLYSLAVR